jgi:hypothetical protein
LNAGNDGAIAQGEKPPAATGMRAARAAETDLQDQLDAARSSIDRIRQDRAELASCIGGAQGGRRRAFAGMKRTASERFMRSATASRRPRM